MTIAPAGPQQPSDPPLKVVLVVRDGLPANQAVNAATVLGASIGTRLGLPLGPEAVDATRPRYHRIVTPPVPILTTGAAELTRLHRLAGEREQLTVLCLTETARRAPPHGASLTALAATTESDTDLVGMIVAGPRNQVTKLTKRLPLLT